MLVGHAPLNPLLLEPDAELPRLGCPYLRGRASNDIHRENPGASTSTGSAPPTAFNRPTSRQ